MQELALIVEAETVGEVSRSELVAHYMNDAAATRADPGCRQFEILLPKENPTRLVFFEIWDSAKAYEDHRNAPHSLRLRATLQGKCRLVQLNWCARGATNEEAAASRSPSP